MDSYDIGLYMGSYTINGSKREYDVTEKRGKGYILYSPREYKNDYNYSSIKNENDAIEPKECEYYAFKKEINNKPIMFLVGTDNERKYEKHHGNFDKLNKNDDSYFIDLKSLRDYNHSSEFLSKSSCDPTSQSDCSWRLYLERMSKAVSDTEQRAQKIVYITTQWISKGFSTIDGFSCCKPTLLDVKFETNVCEKNYNNKGKSDRLKNTPHIDNFVELTNNDSTKHFFFDAFNGREVNNSQLYICKRFRKGITMDINNKKNIRDKNEILSSILNKKRMQRENMTSQRNYSSIITSSRKKIKICVLDNRRSIMRHLKKRVIFLISIIIALVGSIFFYELCKIYC